MKTLLFTLEYPPFKGGVANYYENLVKNWPEPDSILVLNNNEGKLISKWSLPKWRGSVCTLQRMIRKEKIEHVIVGHLLPLGTATYLATRFRRKTSYSVILHGMDFAFAQKSWRKRRVSKKVLKHAENIICANRHTAYLVSQILKDKAKIKVVNPGAPEVPIDQALVQKLKNKYSLHDKTVMFTIGRLVKRKGQDKVLEALPEAQKSVPNLYYFIAGEGPDKMYLREKSKGIKNVFFLGKISEEDKEAWLEICDFFVMPSRDIDGDLEGFGIVYLEAALHAKAVIAGESGGVKDAVQGGLSGILIDPLNTKMITNAIIQLASSPDIRKTLGDNARVRALKDFRWPDKAQKIFNIINK